MDKLEQRMRHMRWSKRIISQDDIKGMIVATLLVDFRMLKIKRYVSTRCPYILLKLYSIVMRALGLDEAYLVALFPLSLSEVCFIKLSYKKTWEDLAQEFLRWYLFNDDVDVTCKEFKSLRQRLDELFLLLSLIEGRRPQR